MTSEKPTDLFVGVSHPKACQEYLDYMRAYNQGKRDEAEHHKYAPFSLFSFNQIKFLVGVGFVYLLICFVIYIIIT